MQAHEIAEATAVTSALHAAVDAARPILAWDDDWDGQGSPAYRAATLERARHFLVLGATRLWDTRQLATPAPQVTLGPTGSIDLHWRGNGRELLLNVPAEADETIAFSGDDERTRVKGEVGPGDDADWLLAWLARGR